MNDTWFVERHEGGVSLGFRVTGTVYRGQSDFQKIEIFETAEHGRLLALDGVVMLTERDEAVYHEMLVHVPLFSHPQPERVLVIGGGDGGTVREVLRHPSVTRCVLVEIDGGVVDACRKHIPSTSSQLDDKRVEVIIGDGVRFVARTSERFDVILVDSTDPVGPATPLFGPEFYGNVARCLSPDGVVVAQGESPCYEAEWQLAILKAMQASFKIRHFYNYSTQSYPGGLWSFAFASNRVCPIRDFKLERFRDAAHRYYYYTRAVHEAAFSLPQFQMENIGHLLSAECCSA